MRDSRRFGARRPRERRSDAIGLRRRASRPRRLLVSPSLRRRRSKERAHLLEVRVSRRGHRREFGTHPGDVVAHRRRRRGGIAVARVGVVGIVAVVVAVAGVGIVRRWTERVEGSAHGGADEDARRGVRGVFANVAVASYGGVVFAVVAGSVEPRWEVGERVVGVHLRDVVVHALVLVDGLTGKGHVLVEARGRLRGGARRRLGRGLVARHARRGVGNGAVTGTGDVAGVDGVGRDARAADDGTRGRDGVSGRTVRRERLVELELALVPTHGRTHPRRAISKVKPPRACFVDAREGSRCEFGVISRRAPPRSRAFRRYDDTTRRASRERALVCVRRTARRSRTNNIGRGETAVNSDDAFVAAVGWTCPAITDSVEVFAWGDAHSGAHDAVRTTPPTSERAVGPVDALRASSITRRNVAWSAARALWKSRAPLGASSRHRPDMLTCASFSAAAPARVRATRAFTVGAGARACVAPRASPTRRDDLLAVLSHHRRAGNAGTPSVSWAASPIIAARARPVRGCRAKTSAETDRANANHVDDDDDAILAFVPSDPFSQTPEERKEAHRASCEEGRRRANEKRARRMVRLSPRRRRRPRHASLPSRRPHPSVPYDSPILAPA